MTVIKKAPSKKASPKKSGNSEKGKVQVDRLAQAFLLSTLPKGTRIHFPGRGLLDGSDPPKKLSPEEEQRNAEIEREMWDTQALRYVQRRIRDKVFREKIAQIIKANPLRRGPKPKDNKPPSIFYLIVDSEKRVMGFKNIWDTLQWHCEIRDLPTDDDFLTKLHNKYVQGRRQRTRQEKLGNSQ